MSYGIGEELLRKMGYVAGQGLGRGGTGITKPIEVNFTPKGMGIGASLNNKFAEDEYYYSSEEEDEEISNKSKSGDFTDRKDVLQNNELKLDVSPQDEQNVLKMKDALLQQGITQFSDNILRAIKNKDQTRVKANTFLTLNEISFVKARKTLQGKENEIDDERSILIEFIKLYKRYIFSQGQLSEEEARNMNFQKTMKSLNEFEKNFSHVEYQLKELENYDSVSEFSTKIEDISITIGKCIAFINNEKNIEAYMVELNNLFELLLTSIYSKAIPKLIEYFWNQSDANLNELDDAFIILADEIHAWSQEIIPIFDKYLQSNNSEDKKSLNAFDSIVVDCLYPKVNNFFEHYWDKQNVRSEAALNMLHNCRKIFNIDVFNYLLYNKILPSVANRFECISDTILVIYSDAGYDITNSNNENMNNLLHWTDLLMDDFVIRSELINRILPFYEKYFEEGIIGDIIRFKQENIGEVQILGFKEIFLENRSENDRLMVMRMLNNTLLKNVINYFIENEGRLNNAYFLSIVYGLRKYYSSMKHREKLYEVLLNEIFIKCYLTREYIRVLHYSFLADEKQEVIPHSLGSLSVWFQWWFSCIKRFTGKIMNDSSNKLWVSTENLYIDLLDILNNCIDMYEVELERKELEQYISSINWQVDVQDVMNKLNHSLIQ